MIKSVSFLIMMVILFSCGQSAREKENIVFEPNWESLAQHNEEPDWFKDAKLGIYFHWGPYSLPAFGDEWYPRWMHFEGRKEYQHHLEKYGHPSEFGYHDFIPMFTAEHFVHACKL